MPTVTVIDLELRVLELGTLASNLARSGLRAPARSVLKLRGMERGIWFACVVAVLVVASGCEPDIPIPPDSAPSYPDLSCAGRPGPTTAPPTIQLRGHVNHVRLDQSGQVLATSLEGVRYEVVKADETVLAYAVTNAAGDWAIDLDTDGQALDVYFRWSKPGMGPWVRVLPDPLHRDITSHDGLNTYEEYAALVARDYPPSPELGTLLVTAIDCSQRPFMDVESVSFNPLPQGLIPGDGGLWGMNLPEGFVDVIAWRGGGVEMWPVRARVLGGTPAFVEVRP